jgi:hypothetical protein
MHNLTLFGVAAAQGKPVAGLHSCDENQWFVDSKLLLFRRLQEGKFASETLLRVSNRILVLKCGDGAEASRSAPLVCVPT